jgi:hypothetical protein
MRVINRFFASFLTVVSLTVATGCNHNNNNSEVSSQNTPTSSVEVDPKPHKPSDRSLLANLKKERDEMRDVSFYTHKSKPNSLHSDLYLYIVDDGSDFSLRLYLKYFSEDWLFVKRAWTKIDGQAIDLPTEREWNRDNTSGYVWETSDRLLSESDISLLKSFATLNNPTIRFEGDQYYEDFKPSRNRLDAILDVIKAYEAAQGIELK